jgi:hypothetical protein
MPFVNRFASPVAPPRFGIVRYHPIIVASGAATAGVLLGAFVAVQLLAPPEKLDAGATSPRAAVETRPAPPIAETTGSAPSAETAKSDGAVADCDKQTWPYLSRDCMKNGGARVMTADKLDSSTVRAIEGSKHSSGAKPAPMPNAPSVTASNPPPAAPLTAVATPESAAKPAPEPPQTPAQAESKPKPKHVAKKQKRKPVRQELNGDDDDNAVASDDSNDRFNDRRAERRRVVQRWNERDRDDDDGPRRVIVIRRGGGGGLFGSLFGSNFGGGGDDD